MKMLPVLEAEESLLLAARVALGTGSMKRHDARELQRTWERRMGRATRKQRGPVDTAGLRAIGIIADEGNT